MIASWMVYALIVGALATIAAEAVDRLLRSRGLPSRWVWVSALAFSAGWPLWLAFRPQEAAVIVSSPLAVSVQSATTVAAQVSESALRVNLDVLLLSIWALASGVVAIRLGYGVFVLATRRRRWRSASVDGVDVRVSEDVGPAVVGFRTMEVVLPNWALSLDAPLRAIVLRHEQEHKRVGDPALLAFAALPLVIAPWNAALWWQSRRLRLAIELDCDARVLGAFPEPERYGLLLLSIAQRRSGMRARLAASLLEPAHHLERRIAAMSPGSGSLSRARVLGLGALGAVAIIGACSADAPPQPVAPRAIVSDTPRTPLSVGGMSLGAIDRDSMMVISRREYERLKAAAGEEEQVRAVIGQTGTPNGHALRRLSSPTGTITEIPKTEPGRVGRPGPLVEQGVVGAVLRDSLERQATLLRRAAELRLQRDSLLQRSRRDTIAADDPTMGGRRGDNFTHVAAGADTNQRAHWEFQIDRPAQWIEGTGAPRYPEMLKTAGVTGSVLATFVVDESGRADLSTFKVLRSSHELFTAAVRNALPMMRFTPATVGNRSVRQVLRQDFTFSIAP